MTCGEGSSAGRSFHHRQNLANLPVYQRKVSSVQPPARLLDKNLSTVFSTSTSAMILFLSSLLYAEDCPKMYLLLGLCLLLSRLGVRGIRSYLRTPPKGRN
jgi:hypothetical protein